jgi:CBS domain-containing protein
MNEKVVVLQLPGSREDLLEAIRTHKYSMFPVVDADTKKFRGIVGRREILRRPIETQLSLLMSTDAPTGKRTDKVTEITKKMLKSNQSKIPIIDKNNKVKGIVSISDIVWRIIAASDIKKQVSDYYTDSITTIWEDTPANVCVHVLAHSGQEALPVVSVKNKVMLTGIISGNDLLKFAEVRSLDSRSQTSESESQEWDPASILIISDKILTIPERPIREIMTKEVVKSYEFTSIKEAATKLRDSKIDQLPVVDEEDNLLGLLTNWHVLKAFLDNVD